MFTPIGPFVDGQQLLLLHLLLALLIYAGDGDIYTLYTDACHVQQGFRYSWFHGSGRSTIIPTAFNLDILKN